MIYLASPYSHPDPEVREQRFELACRAAARLIWDGHAVFCPIAHTHPIAKYGLPTTWDFWQAQDRKILELCEELWVLTIDGWMQSRGVEFEMQIARELGKPIRYVSLDQEMEVAVKDG